MHLITVSWMSLLAVVHHFQVDCLCKMDILRQLILVNV